MLSGKSEKMLTDARKQGWVLEPDAKDMLMEAGLSVPNFRVATDPETAVAAAREIGYPLVAKVVSPKVLHKTEVGGVTVGIKNDEELKRVTAKYSGMDGFLGVHIEEMVTGVELIIGSKYDPQFGPVILLGIGGTSVEIYKDTTIRMAPVTQEEAFSMVDDLKGRELLFGYRKGVLVNLDLLTETLTGFSELVMEMGVRVESIDLNPVMCTAQRCMIADARIMLS